MCKTLTQGVPTANTLILMNSFPSSQRRVQKNTADFRVIAHQAVSAVKLVNALRTRAVTHEKNRSACGKLLVSWRLGRDAEMT